ncbi:hypothetical protein GKZ89_06610 [Bacillus mangrovi]|uniref:Uncharacterized protein n=1 Tax=Metabacillus mangrovi TaxID=1491830 RepID=A0A7X2S3L8_9BACI|nr:hypothetical protein [Metabacillus mangrovi]
MIKSLCRTRNAEKAVRVFFCDWNGRKNA